MRFDAKYERGKRKLGMIWLGLTLVGVAIEQKPRDLTNRSMSKGIKGD